MSTFEEWWNTYSSAFGDYGTEKRAIGRDAYRAGQEEMRERATERVSEFSSIPEKVDRYIKSINLLSLEGDDDKEK